MKKIYAQTVLTEAVNVMTAAGVFSTVPDDSGDKLINALGSLNAVVEAMAQGHDKAQMAAAQVYQVNELMRTGPEGYEQKCSEHEWVSLDNEYVSGVEICKTCLDNGESNVPIRAAK